VIAANALTRVSLWAPVVLYMGAIFYVSSLSDLPLPSGTDKPLHGLVYLGLALVVIRAVVGGLPGRIDMWGATTAILITVGYAVTDEVHQMFVPGRSAEIYDLLADAGGAITGAVVWWAWGIISPVSRDEL
jgi:VanZ family protein